MAVTKKSLVGKRPTKSTAKPTSKLANTKVTASKLTSATNAGGTSGGWIGPVH